MDDQLKPLMDYTEFRRVGLAVDYGPNRSVEIYPRTKDDAKIFVEPEKTVGVTVFFADLPKLELVSL